MLTHFALLALAPATGGKDLLAAPRLVEPASFVSAVADLDHDGDLDFVLLGSASGDVTVLSNDGAGDFTPGWQAPGLAVQPGGEFWPVLADVDGDGNPDLCTAYQSNAAPVAEHGLRVRPGLGDGTFGAPTTYPYPALANPGAWPLPPAAPGVVGSLTAAQLDGDAADELAIVVYFGTLSLNGLWYAVVWQVEGGALVASSPAQVKPLATPRAVDLDGDGVEELALARLANDPGTIGGLPPLAVLALLQDGRLAPFAHFANPWGFWSNDRVDFDSDGDVDFVEIAEDGAVRVLTNRIGEGGAAGWELIELPSLLPASGLLSAFLLGELGADLDGDGRVELVVGRKVPGTQRLAALEWDPDAGAWSAEWRLTSGFGWDPLESTCRHASLSIL